MRKTSLILTAALALAASAAAVAGGDFHHHGHHHSPMMHELKQLNLSEDQKASIKQMVHTSFESEKPQHQKLFQERQAFESAAPGSAASQAAAAVLAQDEAIAASARVQRDAALRAQIYGVLTDAQKTQFASLQAQHQAKMAQWQAEHAKAEPTQN